VSKIRSEDGVLQYLQQSDQVFAVDFLQTAKSRRLFCRILDPNTLWVGFAFKLPFLSAVRNSDPAREGMSHDIESFEKRHSGFWLAGVYWILVRTPDGRFWKYQYVGSALSPWGVILRALEHALNVEKHSDTPEQKQKDLDSVLHKH